MRKGKRKLLEMLSFCNRSLSRVSLSSPHSATLGKFHPPHLDFLPIRPNLQGANYRSKVEKQCSAVRGFELDSHRSKKHGGAGRAGEGAPTSSIEYRICAHDGGLGDVFGRLDLHIEGVEETRAAHGR